MNIGILGTGFGLQHAELYRKMTGIDSITTFGIEEKNGQSHVQALMRYSNSIVNIEGSSMMPYGSPFTVGYEAVFDRGSITYQEDGYEDHVTIRFKEVSDEQEKDIPIRDQNCYFDALFHVVTSIKESCSTNVSLDDSIKSLELASKMNDKLLLHS